MLKQIRKQKGLTQMELAAKSGIHQTLISRLEKGQIKNPSYRVVTQLAAALRVRPEKLALNS